MAGPSGPAQQGSDFNWDHYATAPTGGAANADQNTEWMNSIKQWYRQYLGRDASDAEAQNWANNPNGIGTVEQAIAQSPEAKAYATAHPAASGGASGGAGNPEAFRAAWFASGGKTVDDLKAFVAAHPEFGATITGSKGSKLTFPGGQAFQAVRSAGIGGGIGPAWDDISGGEGGQGGYAGGGSTGLADGSLMAPWTGQFRAPTAEEALNSPGLQFAIQQGQKGIENSAAAKGTLLTGGTLKDLTAYGTGAALQGYGDVYNRAVGEYGINRENFYANQDRPFSKLFNLSSLGAGAANQTGGFGSSYGTNATGSLGDIGNANSAGSAVQGGIWGNYLKNIGSR
jgi:hypothetical protein